jgi:phosphonatase-like hydrolase
MTKPALVIFDMAGTTIEDRGQVPAAFAATLAANGLTITADEIMRVRGASKRQAIRNLLPPATADQCDRIYDEFCRELANTYRTGGVSAVAGAEAAIRRLKSSGIAVALTTGFDRDIATLLLSAVGWGGGLIDALICGDDVEQGRPAPDLILLAMERTGVRDAAQVANIGDTTLDLESAARAGVGWNIGVLSGAHRRDALERAPHTHIIPSVVELDEVFSVPLRP